MNEKERKGWDGPPPSIWTMDLATEKVTRRTPRALYAWDSCWLGNDAIVFASQLPGDEKPSIYRMSLGSDDKEKKVLVKGARLPSVAN